MQLTIHLNVCDIIIAQFWRLEVRHKGCRLSSEEMAFNFAAIIETTDGQKTGTLAGQHQQQSSHHQHYPPLGLLTTANRRLWAQWRHQLLQGTNIVPSLLPSFVVATI